MLEFEDVSVKLGGREVLQQLSFKLGPGRLIGLIGPNGAGKSTLLRAAAGVLKAEVGQVRLCDEPIEAPSALERARRVAYLAQERVVSWPISVRALAALGRGPHRSSLQEDAQAVSSALDRLGLAHLQDRPATGLSGGELARALIARAVAQDSPVLLADEPVASLDPAHQISVMRLLKDLADDGRVVLVSLHDLNLAARWCDELMLLCCGRIEARGTPREVLTAKTLAQIYGVRAQVRSSDQGLDVALLGLADDRRN